jgi:Arylsulfotransferase (ASST)
MTSPPRRSLRKLPLTATLLLALAAALLAALAASPVATSAVAAVNGVAAFPSPGTHYNQPGTQISLRGVSPAAIGALTVTGSSSGAHTGQLAAHSDGQGASFLPDKPFTAGETVTVSTGLNVIGGTNGSFSFVIGRPSRPLAFGNLPLVSAGANGLQHFRSRPDLQPASLTVTKNSTPASEGSFFVAPQFGPAQGGPMILDPQGNLVWFQPYPVSTNTLITDFRAQSLNGQPVLTWWQGNTRSGYGRGLGIIFDRNYRQIATVRAGNGLDMDLHEFLLTEDGKAYIAAASPISFPGVGKASIDCVIQEIDIATGLVVFEWHAFDHVPANTSYFTPKSPGYIYDPYHLNSVAPDASGNLLVSMRDTSAVYDIDHQTGAVIWTLGGKGSSFRMGPSTSTWGQHNAVVQSDGTLTLFDDGAGPPAVHKYSRGLRERLDMKKMTATLVKEYNHSPGLSANFEGGAQVLPSGNIVLGWGQQPYFSENNAAGQQVFDAHFNAPSGSYRVYRYPWSAQPPTTPALALAPNSDGSTSLYASWNGATTVSSWQVLAGRSATTLTPIGGARKRGFETSIPVHSAAQYYAVQALGSTGEALSTSSPAATPAHLAMYGRSVFVNGAGFGGLPGSCFSTRPCRITTTVSVGRTVLARSGAENVGPNSSGILYFRLSSGAQKMLAKARGHRLSVQITERDASRLTATSRFTLVPFSTSGRGPRRSASVPGPVHLLGLTEFVSSAGVGGILAACTQDVPCHVKTTISVGRTVIARAGSEYLGAGEAGYLAFALTSAGRTMLEHAPGNQLGAQVSLTGAGVETKAQVALVRFS